MKSVASNCFTGYLFVLRLNLAASPAQLLSVCFTPAANLRTISGTTVCYSTAVGNTWFPLIHGFKYPWVGQELTLQILGHDCVSFPMLEQIPKMAYKVPHKI